MNLEDITCPIHSFESFGAVDGPGIRYVIFTQGCNLKCKYCQNRDTWCHQGGTKYSVKEVLDKILRYKNYIIPSGGGVTVSGGEPLLHLEFLKALFTELKKEGISIAVLNPPIEFDAMGEEDCRIPVKIVIMFTVAGKDKHIDRLLQVLDMIKDEEILQGLLDAKNKKEIRTVIQKREKSDIN